MASIDARVSVPKAHEGLNVRPRSTTFLMVLLLCLPLLAFIVLSIIGLVNQTTIRQFGSYVCCPKVMSALHISVTTTIISTLLAILLGTPLAYLLAHYQFKGKEVIDTIIDLPLVLPPTAAGLALLMTFGNQGFGQYLQQWNVRIPFTLIAVVMAQLFVASPFFIKHARTGFEAVSNNLKLASMTLGASSFRTFIKITVPLASRALIAGATMTWARALGEVGATLVFAGAFEGRTETMPVAIYTAFTGGNLAAAIVLAATLVGVSFIVLITTKILLSRGAATA